MKKVYYYEDFNTDVVQSKNQEINLKDNYVWIHKSLLYKILSYLLYSIFFIFSIIYSKLILKVTIKNRKILKGKKNYYLYINHTQQMGDAFIPPLITRYKRPYFIVNKANLGIPILGKILPLLGAIVIPDKIHDMIKFKESLLYYGSNHPVIIYPEAHVWPYYTKIRPFNKGSFQLAIENKKTIFCATTTYQKSKYFKRPRITIYIDGPFNYDESLSKKDNTKLLEQVVHEQMEKRAKNSDIEYVIYKQTQL